MNKSIFSINSLSKYSDLFQIVGVIGLIASLIFVGMELRQSHKIALSAQQQARVDNFLNLINNQSTANFPTMVFLNEEIEKMIKESIPDAVIDIKDLAGDNNHYSAIIKSKVFKGMSKIDQHKLVYKSLKGKMGNELHALSLTTEEK